MTTASFLSSVCSSRMTSAVTTLSPASIIVANWREKIWSDLALTFLTARAPLLPAASCERELGREQAAQAQLLARRREVGGVDLAGELGAGGVDRGVGVGSHPLPKSASPRPGLSGAVVSRRKPRRPSRQAASRSAPGREAAVQLEHRHPVRERPGSARERLVAAGGRHERAGPRAPRRRARAGRAGAAAPSSAGRDAAARARTRGRRPRAPPSGSALPATAPSKTSASSTKPWEITAASSASFPARCL